MMYPYTRTRIEYDIVSVSVQLSASLGNYCDYSYWYGDFGFFELLFVVKYLSFLVII